MSLLERYSRKKKLKSLLLVACLLFFFPQSSAVRASQLEDFEKSVVALINGSKAYAYASALENVGMGYPSFRSAGSVGANASALWLATQLQAFGMQVNLESFPFKVWDLKAASKLTIDRDGLASTSDDQQTIPSFTSEHYSWPTLEQGAFADLVVLPLPEASSEGDLGTQPIDSTAWANINTTDKVVLTSNYVLRTQAWVGEFISKITDQRPKAIVYDAYYGWSPEALYSGSIFQGSSGGYPLFQPQGVYWRLSLPTGRVSYADGLRMRELERTEGISANLTVPAEISDGAQLNVVATLPGERQSTKQILVTGHYDSVLAPGFGDNAAGVAGVLELARTLTEAKAKGLYTPAYTVVFIAFSGEELGLVGSAYYLLRHKADASQIAAVFNLDVIGSQTLLITRTETGQEFDLDEVIKKAASDLSVPCTVEEPGGSDQETFRVPFGVAGSIMSTWTKMVDIFDVRPIPSSAMLISYPYSFRTSPPGWIHTGYDNSSSTINLGWITPAQLEEQIKVAALSTLRINPTATTTTTTTHPSTTTPSPVPTIPAPFTQAILVTFLVLTLAITATRFVLRRKRMSSEQAPIPP